jgi:hypothetical protein
VRPLLTYAAETWTMTKIDERRLNIFEKKILCRIYGPRCEKGQWPKRYNTELEDFYSEPNIINIINSSTLRWAGHVTRIEENELPN